MDSRDDELAALLRELSSEGEEPGPEHKERARARLDAEIERSQASASPRRRRLSGRGAALVAALVAIPAGVAVAGGIRSDGGPDHSDILRVEGESSGSVNGVRVGDCPNGVARLQAAGIAADADETINGCEAIDRAEEASELAEERDSNLAEALRAIKDGGGAE